MNNAHELSTMGNHCGAYHKKDYNIKFGKTRKKQPPNTLLPSTMETNSSGISNTSHDNCIEIDNVADVAVSSMQRNGDGNEGTGHGITDTNEKLISMSNNS